MRETKIIADLHESEIEITSILDISLFDLLILQHISYYTKPVVRFKIFEDIVSQLPVKITPPKIYYALDKYKEKGWINYLEGETSRSILVEQTELLKTIISKIFRSLLITYIDINNNFTQIFEKYQEKLNISLPMNNLLLIGSQIDEIYDTSKYEYLANFVNELSIMVEEEKLSSSGIDITNQSYQLVSYQNSRIKEMENYFDIVVFIGIEQYMNTSEINQIINEIYRVTKPGGKIILNSTSKIPRPDHYLLQIVMTQIESIKNYKPKSTQEITDLVDHLKIDQQTIIEDDGTIIVSFEKI